MQTSRTKKQVYSEVILYLIFDVHIKGTISPESGETVPLIVAHIFPAAEIQETNHLLWLFLSQLAVLELYS
jgi:hypothetical protein